jgi:hypothetical protein
MFKWYGGMLTVVLAVLAGSAPVAESMVTQVEQVLWIEEDWVMVLNEPNDNIQSPQFHTIMSPLGHLDANYAQVLWNYRETPGFTGGGIQLQSYDDKNLLRIRTVDNRLLSTQGETITWTQGLWTDGTTLSFYIENGYSQSWGEFGRDMRIDENASIPNLNQYSTDVSVASCAVTYGGNRVNSLAITQVRRYGQDGLISVDSTPRVVYQYLGDSD